MARPILCDNPECEGQVTEEEQAELRKQADEGTIGLPPGWLFVVEVDAAGDDMELGEFCGRECAAAYLRSST